MLKLLLVMLGGAMGAASRFFLANLVSERYATIFPLGTFIINVTGSFLIGVLMMLFLNRTGFNANWRLFLVTGILGGYTTFSSFEWETFAVIRSGASFIALIYVISSVILGLGAVWLGALISNRVWPR
jgi:fluoride exporter